MNERNAVRVVVVDDEILARRGVVQLLANYPESELVGEAGDAQSALPLIEKLTPDVVFLDVEMPGVSGLELANLISGPLVVFVTAFDAYAVAAFEARALDYLLKPVDPDRFEQTWASVVQRLAAGGAPASVFAPQEMMAINRDRGVPARLVISGADGLNVIPLDSLIWVEAADNYVELHTRSGRHLWRRSLAALETEIGPAGFVRIHRSALVRIAEVREVKKRERGDFAVVLSNAVEVAGSRRYRQQFLAVLEN